MWALGTCGEPDEIHLTAMGVELNGSRRVPMSGSDNLGRDMLVSDSLGRDISPLETTDSLYDRDRVCPKTSLAMSSTLPAKA